MRTTGQLWQVLATLPAWQVTEVPRPDTDAPTSWDEGSAQRTQALASAHGTGEPVAIAWIRDQAGGPLRVLAAGPALPGTEDDGQALLTLPPGARGVPLPEGQAAATLARLPCWTRITGTSDVLLTGGQPGSGNGAGPSLEDGLLSAWLNAFGLLVLAEPVSELATADLAQDAARAQQQAELNKAPRSRLAARRFGARHEELRQATVTGLVSLGIASPASPATFTPASYLKYIVRLRRQSRLSCPGTGRPECQTGARRASRLAPQTEEMTGRRAAAETTRARR